MTSRPTGSLRYGLRCYLVERSGALLKSHDAVLKSFEASKEPLQSSGCGLVDMTFVLQRRRWNVP
jgi:hypothetical protein